MTSRTVRYAGWGFLVGALGLLMLVLDVSPTGERRQLGEIWFVPLGAAVSGAVLGALWPKGESRKKRRRAWLAAGLAAAPTLALAFGLPAAASRNDLLIYLGIAAGVMLLAGWAFSTGEELARRDFPMPTFMEPPWDLIRQALPIGFEAPSEPVDVLVDLELDESGVVTRASAASPATDGSTILVTLDHAGRRSVEPKLAEGSDVLATAVAAGFIGLKFQFENPEDQGDWGRFRIGVGVRPEDLKPTQI